MDRAPRRPRRRELPGRGGRPDLLDRRALGRRRDEPAHRVAGRPRPPVHPHQRHGRRRPRRPGHPHAVASCSSEPDPDRTPRSTRPQRPRRRTVDAWRSAAMRTSPGWRSRCSISPTSATTPTPTPPRRCANVPRDAGVAAVCVWPAYVAAVRRCASPAPTSRVATVVNFPSGEEPDRRRAGGDRDSPSTTAPTRSTSCCPTAVAARRRRVGRAPARRRARPRQRARRPLRRTGIVKVIIESGELPDQAAIDRATHFAIAHGADFVKTSTGKTPVSATPEAAEIILEAIDLCGHAGRVQGIGRDPHGRRRPRLPRARRADHGRRVDLAGDLPLRRQRVLDDLVAATGDAARACGCAGDAVHSA